LRGFAAKFRSTVEQTVKNLLQPAGFASRAPNGPCLVFNFTAILRVSLGGTDRDAQINTLMTC
jgi:hypothetical protein